MNRKERLAKILRETARDRELAGVVVRIERPSDSFSWTGAVGEFEVESPFFIASVTKLYTTAIVLQQVARGELELETPLVNVLDPELLMGLHVISGVDRTAEITVRHLLAHTSGLPDYFIAKSSRRHAGPRSLEKMVRGGNDVHWSFEDVLGWARTAGAVFPPGARRKALYSDTNFQLLGKVIETVEGQPYGKVLQRRIFAPLGLRNTWLYEDPGDSRPVALRDGPKQLHIPKAMTSFGPDGGVVSTSGELMQFLRAFFAGELFAGDLFQQLRDYRKIFFPLQYGVGFARFQLPRILAPFGRPPELLGHSGLSGAFAFHSPADGLFLAGTVNNIRRPDRSFRLMFRLQQALRQ